MKKFSLLLLCLTFSVRLYGIGLTVLSISKSGPATVTPNTNITYNITVTNSGPYNALTTAVTDVLPAGTTYVSATSSLGSCSGTSTVTCSLGTVVYPGSATITLVVLSPSTTGTVSNTATLTAFNMDPSSTSSSTWNLTVAVPTVPTLSTWSLLLLALLLAGCAAQFIRKARA